ncbi:pseudouridylate synthase RPUSD4, mitochondrial-like [Diadema setosum]|uniref:pseudouridylate synthase RPUSD4, mitochondrial-like n=1 Tax=Diadema setosum TaxID=31175 RepID=UPI003B3A5330
MTFAGNCERLYLALRQVILNDPRRHICGRLLSTTPRMVLPRGASSATQKKPLTKSQPGKETAADAGSASRDVFVDGEVTHKKTLWMTLERMGLSKDADPNQAVTLSARIRKQLQEKMGKGKAPGQQGEGQEEEEEESPSKRKARNLRHQTRDLSRLTGGVVASILRERVIYDDGDIIALDKPYGLPVHGGPGVRHSIDSLLPWLARKLDRAKSQPELHLIHRLDKETTGVILLARSEMTARALHELFRKREIIKRYWVITVGVPSPREGILDMPMKEQEVAGKHRMVVKPDLGDVYPESWGVRLGRDRDAHTAITKYKVLHYHHNCALVQLEPSTGVKHQIRVHLAQGLGCPILGDHKYSHQNKLAPQRLTDSILRSLGITQPKARTVPMHLHARQLIIPHTFNGRNISISTKVPWHFGHNMKRLKLKFDP